MGPMEKIIACELSFLPIGTERYLREVDRVLAIIDESGLDHSVGEMSTVIRGKSVHVWDTLRRVSEIMDGYCHFSMIIKVSNLCGCEKQS